MNANRWTAQRSMGATIAIAVLCAACGNGKPAKNPSDKPKEPELTDAEVAATLAEDDGLAFDEEQAQIVLKRGDRKARNCDTVAGDAPTGEGELEVVFDGPKGRVVEVKIGYNFQGSGKDALQCIKNSYLGEIIPPFDGTKTVTHVLNMSPTEGADKKKDGE